MDTIPHGANFQAKTKPLSAPQALGGGVVGTGDSYALEVDSPTAVRTLNQLVANGVAAQLALASFTSGGATYPAGTAVFPATRRRRRRSTRPETPTESSSEA